MAILEKIRTTKTYQGKSEMTSGNAYKVRIYYNGKYCQMVFHDNYQNKSDKNDFLYSLLMDADAYNNTMDLDDFASAYGYEKNSECIRAYKACKAQAKKVERLFTEEEVEAIYAELEEAGY